MTEKWSRPVLFLLLVSFLLGCSGTKETGEGSIKGTVLWNDNPVKMAWIEVYERPERDRSIPPIAETASGEGGLFELKVKPGKYYIWAKATIPGDGREHKLVGQATPGPVEVRPSALTSAEIILADAGGFASSTGPKGAGIEGRVTNGASNGKGRVMIYIYHETATEPIGPGFLAAVEAQMNGTFKADLSPGKYKIAARLRKSGRDYGPPAKDDLLAFSVAEVAGAGYSDVGTMRLALPDPVKWTVVTTKMGHSGTSVGGSVSNGDGTPAKGIRVLAFSDPKMAGKPLAISPPTGADGAFLLSLPKGGTFFLGARSKIGGPSSPGERVGAYRGADGAGLALMSGQNQTGVAIVVQEVW